MDDMQFQTVGRKFLTQLIETLKGRGAVILMDKLDNDLVSYRFKTKRSIEPMEMMFAYEEDYQYYVRKYLTRC